MTYSNYSLQASTSQPSDTEALNDFGASTADLGWYVQNDSVMGGLSEGSFQRFEGMLIFTGTTNTNGGGFSSIRTKAFQLDLSANDGIKLRIKGDGRRYSWQLQTNATWRGRRISYWADFETQAGDWITVEIPFSEFAPQFRGRRLDGPTLDPTQLTSMGLYIYDKQDGPFEIHLDRVGVYQDS